VWLEYVVLPIYSGIAQTENTSQKQTLPKLLLANIEIGETIPETIAAKVPTALASVSICLRQI
jgi:hypothetical protein